MMKTDTETSAALFYGNISATLKLSIILLFLPYHYFVSTVKDSGNPDDDKILHSVFKLVKLFPGMPQLCEIKSCEPNPTWSKEAFSLCEIGAPLML